MADLEKKPTWILPVLIDNLGAAIVLAIIVLTFLQVFFRYILARPLSWSEEMARYFLIFLAAVGSAMAMYSGGHIVIETFIKKLPPGIKRVHQFFKAFCILAFLAVVAYYGVAFAVLNSSQRSASMPWLSMFWPNITIPAGAVLMGVFTVLDLSRRRR